MGEALWFRCPCAIIRSRLACWCAVRPHGAGVHDALISVSRVGLDRVAEATGTVIVIDVLRAFTTAAFAFAAGAEAIVVVSGVEEAFALREKNADWLIMGEEGGLPVEGFDFDNSPAGFIGRDLTGNTLIQRTTSGTQGVVRSRRARHLFASSLCCARATVRAVASLRPRRVTMVITGSHADGLRDEDLACADYLEALIRGKATDDQKVVERVLTSRAAQKFKDPGQPQFSPADLDCAVDIDRFPFAIQVWEQGGQRVMTPVSREEMEPRDRWDGTRRWVGRLDERTDAPPAWAGEGMTSHCDVVLDTNIFVAAGFNPRSASAEIIGEVRAGRLRLIWDEATRRETEAVVRRIPPLSWETFAGLFQEEHRYEGKVHPGEFEDVPDAADRKFAALAAAADAALVTNDGDLLGSLPADRVRVLTPATFVTRRSHG